MDFRNVILPFVHRRFLYNWAYDAAIMEPDDQTPRRDEDEDDDDDFGVERARRREELPSSIRFEKNTWSKHMGEHVLTCGYELERRKSLSFTTWLNN